MLRVTADTNIIVSGLNFPGKPRSFLAAAESGVVRLCVSSAILKEVAEVLQPEKFGWSAADAKEAINWISQIADLVEPTEAVHVIEDDPSDNRILECAAAAKSDYIVSGDTHLLRLRSFGGKPVLVVSEFLEILQTRPR